MKKITAVILAFAASFVLFSCDAKTVRQYADFTPGGGEAENDISDLVIDWINGKVKVEYGDTDKIIFGESSEKEIPSGSGMCYKVSGSVLSIAYSKHETRTGDLSKDLTVTLPRETKLGAIYINTVSADVDLSDIAAPGILEAETVSGSVYAKLTGNPAKMLVTTVSGSITLNTGKIGEGVFKTTSGDMKLTADEAPKRATFDTMSGSISLYYPKEPGMTIDYTTISGEFSCGYDEVTSGKTHIIGSGEAMLTVTTISGNLRLRSAKLDSSAKDTVR